MSVESDQAALLAGGLQQLRQLLGESWTVDVRGGRGAGADALVDLRMQEPGASASFLVDLRATVTPRVIKDLLAPKLELIRQVNEWTNLLVISRWIAPPSQRLLRETGINYVDLTGNVSVRSTRPAIAIYTQGAAKAPAGLRSGSETTTLAGLRAGQLVRVLVDVVPPYRPTALADWSGLSLSYVSKLLDTLEEQLLIRREKRAVVDVDWPNLLRSRATHLNLLKNHSYVGAIAPNGIPGVLEALLNFTRRNSTESIVITGSYAARTVAPTAVGGQLMLYASSDFDSLIAELGLLPADDGADVLLLRPNNDLELADTKDVDGLPRVALSQIVLDCLSGPGRMPAEGEAVISYMAENESAWRRSRE